MNTTKEEKALEDKILTIIYTDQSEFTVWGYPIRAQEEVSTEFCLHGFSCLLYVRGRELSSYSLS